MARATGIRGALTEFTPHWKTDLQPLNLSQTYEVMLPSIVAFTPKFVLREGPNDPPPQIPPIFGTGFIIDSDGVVATNKHVIEHFQHARDPMTGKPAVRAILINLGTNSDGRVFCRWVPVDVRFCILVESYDADGPWFGQPVPDIGFAYLNVRDVPAVQLATEDYSVQTGMPIATAGYPMGDTPMAIFGSPTQMTPFLRQGIVSSTFPFSISQPHGFTIDIMQQGGSSGSPIFRTDAPIVVGMMSHSMLDVVRFDFENKSHEIHVNTNMSIALTAAQIAKAWEQFKPVHPPKVDGIPTFEERLASIPTATTPAATWKLRITSQ